MIREQKRVAQGGIFLLLHAQSAEFSFASSSFQTVLNSTEAVMSARVTHIHFSLLFLCPLKSGMC